MQGYSPQDYGGSTPDIKYASIPKIRVVIRKRPLSSKEISRKDEDVINVESMQSLILKEIK
jgi:hypothetical protein